MEKIRKKIQFLEPELIEEIVENAQVHLFKKGTEILREEQYVKVLPIVLNGLVKVYSKFNDRELLLYYIEPSHSCIMSFSACRKNQPSRVFAETEEDSEILLLPVNRVQNWLKQFPKLANLFYEEYDTRYGNLLESIHDVLINRMDKRLYDYLVEKSRLINQTEIKISHSQIANELGSVREVISRAMKKIELEGLIVQTSSGIKINCL